MRSLRFMFIIAVMGCIILHSVYGICSEDTISPVVSPKKLISMTNYDFSVLTVEIVPATDSMPEYCDVRGVIPSEIKFAIKLPTNWNGRFQMVGNHGWGGEIDYSSMEIGLIERYAVAATDTGHDSNLEPDATFAYNNRQKEIDFAFRAVHLTAVTAKNIIETYYGTEPSYSYWVGCSTGGRQGLMEAQRFPDDFDGILAGAPDPYSSFFSMLNIWYAKALLSGNIESEKLEILAEAVYGKCDEKDGLKDGIIENPLACNFDPTKDLPKCPEGTEGTKCFTEVQIEALKKIYGGIRDSKENLLFPGQPPGAEAISETPLFLGGTGFMSGWEPWIVGNSEANKIFSPSETDIKSIGVLDAETFTKYIAFEEDNPNYDWKTFNFDTDPQRMAYIQSILDAADPDLSDFKELGGKIIHYHGWADGCVNPLMSVKYYDEVLELMGKETSEFYKLYMVPGMFHCGDGVGCDETDWFTPLVNWVENGIAPEELTGAHSTDGNIDRTRPICPYPKTAKYKGSGDINDAVNFVCVEP